MVMVRILPEGTTGIDEAEGGWTEPMGLFGLGWCWVLGPLVQDRSVEGRTLGMGADP